MSKDKSAIREAINRGIKCVTEQYVAAVPLQTPGPNTALVSGGGRFGSRQKRLLALIHEAKRMLKEEMQEQFPDLEGKEFHPYAGWHIGWEQSGADVAAEARAKTGDLFPPRAADRDVLSTRSADIRPNGPPHRFPGGPA